MKKYAVYPGYVISRYDGEKHYVGYRQLIALYKVNPSECYNATVIEETVGRQDENIKHLFPRNDGRYVMP